jgi:cytochrome c oxidase subunit 4
MQSTSAQPQAHTRPHPNYVGIFGWLTVFTILELAVSFITANEIKVPLLVIFATSKASLVVLYYMHLRYDSRWYAVILLSGVGFALLVGWFLPLVQK